MRKLHWLSGLIVAWLPCLAAGAGLPFVLEQLPQARPAQQVLAGEADAEFVRAAGHDFKPPHADSEYWLRIRLPHDLPDEQLVLAIRRVPIDHITLYYRDRAGAWKSLQSGTLSRRDALPFNVCCFGFELPQSWERPTAAQVRTLYLHVRDSSPTAVILRLQTWREFSARDRAETITVSLVLGTLLAMFAVNALFWSVLRDNDYLHLAIFQGSLAIYLAHSADLFHRLPDDFGFGMPGKFPWLIAAGLAVSFSASFIQRFVNLAVHWPRFSRATDVLRYLALGISMLTVLPYAGLSEYVRQGFNGSLLVLSVLSCLAPILTFRHARRPALFVLSGWVIYALLVTDRVQAAMGFSTLTAFSQYGFQIGSGLLAVALTIGLADRTLQLRQQRDRAQFLRDQALKRLDIERARRALADDLSRIIRSGRTDIAASAYRRMLTALGEVLPLDRAAVMVEAGNAGTVLVCEPDGSQPGFADLSQRRVTTLRSIAQSRRPLVLAPDEDETLAKAGSNVAVVPIANSADRWGVALLSRPRWQKFARREFDLVADFAILVGRAIKEAGQQAQLKQLASFDALTGALNRGNVETLLEHAFRQAVHQHEPFSVLFIDLDYFKSVNDRHGHSVGDACLAAAAQRISRALHPEHALGRYGGEEFLVLLPHTEGEAARQLAEQIRTAVSGQPVDAGAAQLTVTVSIGGASRAADEATPRMLLERADQALYQAKREGRDRAVWAGSGAAG